MLFRPSTLERIARGEVTVAFRRWKRPMVRAGGTQRTHLGVVAFTSVEAVDVAMLTAKDAREAGFDSLAALLEAQGTDGEGAIYRIGLHLAGPDPRVALRHDAELSGEARASLEARLRRLDAASLAGLWTAAALRLIAEHQGRRAGDLAPLAGMEMLPFKRNVRKLKELGLTESLEVGYRLSPRGEAYLQGAR